MVRNVRTFMDIKKASDMHNNVVKHTKKKRRGTVELKTFV